MVGAGRADADALALEGSSPAAEAERADRSPAPATTPATAVSFRRLRRFTPAVRSSVMVVPIHAFDDIIYKLDALSAQDRQNFPNRGDL